MSVPGPTPAEGSAIVHGLRWGLKRSFLEYVRRMPDGKGWVGNGAVPIAGDEMFFSYDAEQSQPAEAGEPGTVYAFAGDVRFSGHFGMLSVHIVRPWLQVDGDSAVLTIADSDGRRRPLVRAQLQQVQLAEASPASAIIAGTAVRLDEAGVELFNDVYPAGEPFEDFVIQVPVATAPLL